MHIMPVIQDIARDVYEFMVVRQLVRWILHCKSHESIVPMHITLVIQAIVREFGVVRRPVMNKPYMYKR